MNQQHSAGILSALALAAVVTFIAMALLRDQGHGGPHHDEVIALLASKGLEGGYDRLLKAGDPPFHEIVHAAEWQQFIRNFKWVSFADIRSDVLNWDRHPPLAFWAMNRWLTLFEHGGYAEAVWLTSLQVVLTAFLLAMAVYRVSRSREAALLALVLFLAGNSAIFTATWVRQYALLTVFYAALALAAIELSRPHISKRRSFALAGLIGALSLLGMLTQYTFLIMSAPIHAVLVIMLAFQGRWQSVTVLMVAYFAAGLAFFALMPSVLDFVTAVATDVDQGMQWMAAFGGIASMYVPMPSGLPRPVLLIAGAAGLAAPFVMAGFLLLRYPHASAQFDRILLMTPLAGMLGAGLLQFTLVGLGYFPGWATGPNHMAAFWLLTVFAASLLWCQLRFSGKGALTSVVFVVLLGMQCLYIWHLHRIAPKLNKSYISSHQPDLVLADNLARGFVLELAAVMSPEQPVLVTDSLGVAERFASGSLNAYPSILYLPMDHSVRQGKAGILAAAQASGWEVTELPAVHAGMYEAVWIERK